MSFLTLLTDLTIHLWSETSRPRCGLVIPDHFSILLNDCYCCPVTKLCRTLCNPMDCSTPSLPVPHYLTEIAQVHVHWIGDAIQPFYPLQSSSPFALNLSQHQGLFQWVGWITMSHFFLSSLSFISVLHHIQWENKKQSNLLVYPYLCQRTLTFPLPPGWMVHAPTVNKISPSTVC